MKKGIARAAALLAVVVGSWIAPQEALAQLGSLIVTVTSPASGSTVSGTVTVSASVSIVGSVSRVDFFVDGNFIGSDSGAPYSVSWDTRNVGNGSHTLTAVAQDVLGVRWTSDAVSVTVSNVSPPTISGFSPTSGPVGAIVTISGTNFAGATAVTFNTVSAAFIVDSATSIRAEVPTGATTGTIRVTTPGGTATSASAFTVQASPPPGGTQRFEESDPAVVASPAGAWVRRGAEVAAFSGGTAGSSDSSGATVTFSFTGTAVSWIGLRCSVCGIATVSIDGGAATSVDTAGPAAPGSPGLTSEVVFTASSLTAGSHTMVITVTGTTTSGGAHIVVDAFDVTGTATRIEDTDPAVSYTGTWVHGTDVRATGGTYADAQVAGAVATLSFTGTGVGWLSYRNYNTGIARASVDGVFVGEVDTYGPSAGSAVVFTATGFPRGAHTLTIEVTGTKNQASTDTWVIIDAFDVTP